MNGTFRKGRERSEPNTKRKQGGQLGNTNAAGHGGTGPPENSNAEKFGFFRKHLPKETLTIIEEMPENPLDILWNQIQISYAAIIRAQQIMYVRGREDVTTTKIEEKFGNTVGERWEVQQAWDKQGEFLKSQSRAQAELRNMVKTYLELDGKSKTDADTVSKDWKAAIIEIAKRRNEKNG